MGKAFPGRWRWSRPRWPSEGPRRGTRQYQGPERAGVTPRLQELMGAAGRAAPGLRHRFCPPITRVPADLIPPSAPKSSSSVFSGSYICSAPVSHQPPTCTSVSCVLFTRTLRWVQQMGKAKQLAALWSARGRRARRGQTCHGTQACSSPIQLGDAESQSSGIGEGWEFVGSVHAQAPRKPEQPPG